jgi:hypothetical protein
VASIIDSKTTVVPGNLPLAHGEKSEPDAFYVFNKRLDFSRLPSKGINVLLTWGELMPLNKSLIGRVSACRMTGKTIYGAFCVPKFFTKQIKLYQVCQSLKGQELTFCRVKKIFYAFLGVAIATVKMPLFLDKTRFINLRQVSLHLPGILGRGEAVLVLGILGMRLGSGSVSFSQYWKQSQCAPGHAGLGEILHTRRGQKLGVKVLSSTVKTGLALASVASLFFGWQLPPLALITASTFSFTLSVTSKMLFHREIVFGKMKKIQCDEDLELGTHQKKYTTSLGPGAQIPSLI